MALARYYEINSGLINITGSTAVPILFMSTGSTVTANVLRLKVSIEGVSSPAPPNNGSVYFSLNVVTGTKGGGSAVTPAPTTADTLASNVTCSSGSTSLTGLTASTELWGAAVPFASGAAWEDAYENTGLEVYLKASGQWAVYMIAASGFGSGCAARVILNTAE